ncbi:tRNA pseudouridine(13) synthase TruD [Halorubrum sp. 48-1-W]|uniref:tRNA pseudouridine(13) synthase TruD n=1 Tax=Halorubrum sp. 48-1-W TaxID=2249761 RepID=UPI000DCE82A8|nr:tRNA pseudouridine(13) synthase TruD [Halorubrum sp. 48-1-W]RAW46523.1 tRNA pseudouridine(13) synthase TruD [Halorubrum sp. 48-1-W]
MVDDSDDIDTDDPADPAATRPPREAHPVERAVGIDYFVSGAPGIGGRLRERPEDFRVTELEAFEPDPLGSDRGGYPELVVRATLRNWDTNDFARRVSDAMGISRERVSWAGTKDKRAVTTQLFTLRSVDPDDLPEIRGVEIEPIGRAGRGLSFGDLAGNAFEVRVADAVAESEERVAAVARDLRAFAGAEPDDPAAPVAVPNYFGQQRFGSVRPVTHLVGLAVVRGDFREAVRLYAGNPSPAEPDDTRAGRDRVDEAFGVEAVDGANAPEHGHAPGVVADGTGDGDWGGCLEAMPRKLRFERGMLSRLAERDVDPAVPPADDDWRHALEAVPSNLQRLFVNAAQSALFNRIVSERLRRGLSFHRPVAGDVACFADRDAPEELYAPDPDREQRVTADRVPVMARHCARGRAFVTAPLVGTDTELADGEPGEIARAVLHDAGIEPADFDLPGEFDSTGTRRAIQVRTDLDVTFEGGDPAFAFALPSGSYATVLLREFTKTDPLER